MPATIVAPVPGPPDFNGASAVIARLPNIGFAPSMLTEKGFEVNEDTDSSLASATAVGAWACCAGVNSRGLDWRRVRGMGIEQTANFSRL